MSAWIIGLDFSFSVDYISKFVTDAETENLLFSISDFIQSHYNEDF